MHENLLFEPHSHMCEKCVHSEKLVYLHNTDASGERTNVQYNAMKFYVSVGNSCTKSMLNKYILT